ncbi:MAG: hypothetical protein HKN47_07585 [Pirellulaceae bacterium]|nr:hypothetical protein [Pirellulaceae bacterium]
MHQFFLRLGSLAEIRRAHAVVVYPRSRRVVVRTARGLEIGEVVGRCDPSIGQNPLDQAEQDDCITILRATTEEDELLVRRLERHKRRAIESCREALVSAGSTATLLDVDQLLDGGTLVMHFLGPVDEIAQSITARVASEYESVVRSRHLAKLLRDGCGPDCGTSDGGGCGTSCSGCSVAAACKTTSA